MSRFRRRYMIHRSLGWTLKICQIFSTWWNIYDQWIMHDNRDFRHIDTPYDSIHVIHVNDSNLKLQTKNHLAVQTWLQFSFYLETDFEVKVNFSLEINSRFFIPFWFKIAMIFIQLLFKNIEWKSFVWSWKLFFKDSIGVPIKNCKQVSKLKEKTKMETIFKY